MTSLQLEELFKRALVGFHPTYRQARRIVKTFSKRSRWYPLAVRVLEARRK